MEPGYAVSDIVVLISNISALGIPFIFYFIGIIIRKYGFPEKIKIPLYRLLLVGFLTSFVVVPILVPILEKSITNPYSFIIMLGIIMEQGISHIVLLQIQLIYQMQLIRYMHMLMILMAI